MGEDRSKRYRSDKKLKRDVWFDELLQGRKCAQCEESHRACLEFHHRDASTKFKEVGVLVHSGYSEEKVLAEIAKCDVLCSNCHKKMHYEKRNSLSDEERTAKEKRYKEISRGNKGRINIKHYVCTDPDGINHSTPNGLSHFCRTNGLCINSFMKVLKGKQGHHKGWTIKHEQSPNDNV